MKAIVLEPDKQLNLRSIEIEESFGPHDVRIKIDTVGICGSDIHYYKHGSIGPFVVREPMILGHEASGTVVETGVEVKGLKIGDRVCMEPGIPNSLSLCSMLGQYNLDPDVRFWATPPVHGCLRPTVVHPAQFTFRLPDNVSFAEGAMIEPLAVAVHAVTKAKITPGDCALVLGAGPIGLLTVQAALAAGCSTVIVTDIQKSKLDLANIFGSVISVLSPDEDLSAAVLDATNGKGADVVFECSGSTNAYRGILDNLAPGGCLVLIGMPKEPVAIDVVAAQVKEARIETTFRYVNAFPRSISLIAAGKINVNALITDTFSFSDGVNAIKYAANMNPSTVKVQIALPEEL